MRHLLPLSLIAPLALLLLAGCPASPGIVGKWKSVSIAEKFGRVETITEFKPNGTITISSPETPSGSLQGGGTWEIEDGNRLRITLTSLVATRDKKTQDLIKKNEPFITSEQFSISGDQLIIQRSISRDSQTYTRISP